jgi:hypothetical protein
MFRELPGQSESLAHMSLGIWHEKLEHVDGMLPNVSLPSMHSHADRQFAPEMHVDGKHRPTGSSQLQMSPEPQSESRMHPYSHVTPIPKE